ncbi:energy-coupling factor ABC transporter ATP-binding protein [Microbacterium sp. ZXX196]|uniref:energy-coupling factor ABC transporter ATP-binding protein n=1 Tax=Microbacterium sp. ZXX196 TaxID=2609291 RepID=UPI00132381D8|nr:ATP-binding cassette domain-containing protein [Microbacterium sp. ZXX196]
MIEAHGLGVEIDGATILADVTVALSEPRVAVIGRNGSGKSTFARTLNGLVRPTAGRVEVDGVDVGRAPKRARERVGFLFTQPEAQILMPTPAEDLALSARAAGVPRAEVAGRVAAHLEAFGLAAHANQPAYSLSGGQKQLLALAAVLLGAPRILVADEPTTLLDLHNARRIGDLLLSGAGARQVVLVTHDLDLAARCDVALRFDEGRLAAVGAPDEIIAAYRAEAA